MDYIYTAFIALILFIFAVDKILKRLSLGSKKGKRDWPKCLNCKKGCYRMPTIGTNVPEEITHTLQKYDLPEKVVTRFQCETGCSNIWWIPQLADMPKGVMRTVKVR